MKLIQDPDILNDCIKYGRMDGRVWLQKTQDGDGHNARLEASPQTKPSEGTVGSHLDILYKEFY